MLKSEIGIQRPECSGCVFRPSLGILPRHSEVLTVPLSGRIGKCVYNVHGIASLAAEWNFASLNVFISSRIQ